MNVHIYYGGLSGFRTMIKDIDDYMPLVDLVLKDDAKHRDIKVDMEGNRIRKDEELESYQSVIAFSEDYSSFSVLCQWAYDVKPLMDLGGGNFWPRPNVDSRAVLMTKKEDFPRCKNPQLFVKVQRALFSSRRKNVRNNLSNYLKNNDKALEYLNTANIDFTKRAEVLSIEELIRLADVMDQDKR